MNKYFLPVYHSELKPWIKWWILKRLNGGESSLKTVTISSGTLTKVDKSKALSIKEYYGNTVQNGTPTPESPVEIKTISGDNTFTINGGDYRVDFGGKNLFNKEIPEDNKNVRLNISGVFYSDTGYFISNAIEVLPNTQYTVNYTVTTLSRICYYTGISVSTFISKNDNSATFTTPSNCKYVRFCNLLTNIDTIQLEKGTVATEYSPYVSNPIELCKIGDYKDKIYNDNGTWKVEKNIGKVVLNGTENWANDGGTVGTNYRHNIQVSTLGIATPLGTTGNALTDHFKGVTVGNNNYDWGNFYLSATWLVIHDKDAVYDSKANFVNWLTTHNTDLYYVLATPSYETITNANLISQLNALYEFYVESSKVTISNNSEITLEVLLEYYGR